MFKLLSLFVLFGLFSKVFSQCSDNRTLFWNGQTTDLIFPNMISGNCPSFRFKIIAPVNSIMEVSCRLWLSTTDCSEIFEISRSGDDQLRDSLKFCQTPNRIDTRSIGNEVVVSIFRGNQRSSSFYCVVKAVAQTNENCDCGWNVRTRIVGGTAAGVNEFVSHAGLVSVQGETIEVFCGGIILTQNWVLTAAHCFVAYPDISSTVLLTGDHDLSRGTDTIWSAVYLLQFYIKHENFNPSTNVNDIALVRTKGYIRFNPGTGPGCMPYTFMNNDRYFDGKNLTVVGWGAIEFSGPSSNVLKKAQVRVIETGVCRTYSGNELADNTKVCTFDTPQGSSCTKDSGSGLYWLSARYFAIGLVGYGQFCGGNVPSVNTRITSYVGWIERNVNEFMCRK